MQELITNSQFSIFLFLFLYDTNYKYIPMCAVEENKGEKKEEKWLQYKEKPSVALEIHKLVAEAFYRRKSS